MSYLVLFGLILLSLALPDLCPPVLGLDRHPPDLWLVIVVYLALRCPGYRAVPWGVGVGLVRDAASIDPLGTHGFILGTVAFLFCEGRRRRGAVDGGMALLAVLAAGLVAGWLYPLRTLPATGSLSPALFAHGTFTAITTTVLAAGLLPLFDRYHLLDEIGGRARGVPA